MDKIAVFLNNEDALANFYDCVKYKVYIKKNNTFVVVEENEYGKFSLASPMDIKNNVESISNKLEDCNTIAAKDMTGVAYTNFDRRGFNIFLVEDYSYNTLQGICNDIEAMEIEKQEKLDALSSTTPIETETPGVYFIDLIVVQKNNPQISSKKAIKDFLENTPFMELRLVCSHIPPWIENDGNYKIVSTKVDNYINAVVTKKQC